MKKLATTAVVGSLLAAASVASANPFAAKNMPNGYQNEKTTTSKKADAKCGGQAKVSKKAEAKCGATTQPAKTTKTAEAKCGEAKCGAGQ